MIHPRARKLLSRCFVCTSALTNVCPVNLLPHVKLRGHSTTNDCWLGEAL